MKAGQIPAWVYGFKLRGKSGKKCGCAPRCAACTEYARLASLFRYYTRRDERLSQSARYYKSNKGKHSEKMRLWYIRNRDAVKAKTSAYAKSHRDMYRAAYRKSYWKHRERYVAISIQRRVHRKVSEFDMKSVIRANRNRLGSLSCYLCGKKFGVEGFAFEHIVPVKRGGLTHAGNLDLAHRSCNSSKGALTLIEYKRKVSAC